MSTSAPKERIPPGLLVGLIGLGVGSALIRLGWGETASGDRGDLESQLRLGGPALVIAALAVALGGAADLRARMPGALRAGAQLVVAGLGLLLAREILDVVRGTWFAAEREFHGHDAFVWMQRLGLVAILLLAAGVLAVGWASERVRMIAGPLVGLAILAQPPMIVLQWTGDFGHSSPWVFHGIHATAEVGFAGLALFAIREAMRRAGQPTARPWHQAAAGYFQAGSALTARIAIMVIGVAFAMFAIVTRSPNLLKVYFYLVPLGVMAVTIGLVRAILRAASDDDHDAPAVRLHLAAGLITFAMVVPTMQAIVLYKSDAAAGIARVLDVAAPAAGLGGFLCLISAIGTVAERTRLSVTREATVRAALLVTGASAAAVAVQQWFAREVATGTEHAAGVFALTVLVTAAAAIFAILQVARLCQRISADLHTSRDGAALPRAEARVAELPPEQRH